MISAKQSCRHKNAPVLKMPQGWEMAPHDFSIVQVHFNAGPSKVMSEVTREDKGTVGRTATIHKDFIVP